MNEKHHGDLLSSFPVTHIYIEYTNVSVYNTTIYFIYIK